MHITFSFAIVSALNEFSGPQFFCCLCCATGERNRCCQVLSTLLSLILHMHNRNWGSSCTLLSLLLLCLQWEFFQSSVFVPCFLSFNAASWCASSWVWLCMLNGNWCSCTLLLPVALLLLQWENFLLFTFVLYGEVYCCLCWVLNLSVHNELGFLLSDFHRLCSENFLFSFWLLCALRRGAISFPYCNFCCHFLSLVLSAQQWALICGCDSSYVSFCPLKEDTKDWERLENLQVFCSLRFQVFSSHSDSAKFGVINSEEFHWFWRLLNSLEFLKAQMVSLINLSEGYSFQTKISVWFPALKSCFF